MQKKKFSPAGRRWQLKGSDKSFGWKENQKGHLSAVPSPYMTCSLPTIISLRTTQTMNHSTTSPHFVLTSLPPHTHQQAKGKKINTYLYLIYRHTSHLSLENIKKNINADLPLIWIQVTCTCSLLVKQANKKWHTILHSSHVQKARDPVPFFGEVSLPQNSQKRAKQCWFIIFSCYTQVLYLPASPVTKRPASHKPFGFGSSVYTTGH